jgi:hypothetical protein
MEGKIFLNLYLSTKESIIKLDKFIADCYCCNDSLFHYWMRWKDTEGSHIWYDEVFDSFTIHIYTDTVKDGYTAAEILNSKEINENDIERMLNV